MKINMILVFRKLRSSERGTFSAYLLDGSLGFLASVHSDFICSDWSVLLIHQLLNSLNMSLET